MAKEPSLTANAPNRVVALRVLILGGSSEASAIAHAIAGMPEVAATLSLAGRTNTPDDFPIPTRTGGFGGVHGLAAYLREEGVDLLVDATHPFAAQMSRHARAAADEAGIAMLRVGRGAWQPQPGDQWLEVDSMTAAATALGTKPRRVFLTVGRLQLAAFAGPSQHTYLVRTIEPVDTQHGLHDATFITQRGPFDVEAEVRLMHDHAIDVLVTKNSGGDAAAAKLAAARQLGLPVILVLRPAGDEGLEVPDALAAIEAHCAAARRGV